MLSKIEIPERELEFTAIRAQGAGGQNVNKVSSAIQLRFDIEASSLPDAIKRRMRAQHDRRITEAGVLVIKAQTHRTQEQNRSAALERLRELVEQAAVVPKRRRRTRPTKSSKEKTRAAKLQRGKVKSLRGKVRDADA